MSTYGPDEDLKGKDLHDNDPGNAALLQRAREALDARTEGLDAATLGRLRAVRRTALQATAPRRSRWRSWMPAAGLAGSLAIAGLLAIVLWPGSSPTTLPTNRAADFEMLTSDAGLELYQDLDFYLWLQVDGEHTPVPQSSRPALQQMAERGWHAG